MSNSVNNCAVIVRDATKIYYSHKKCNVVFENLNMTVAKWKIYGLLGPSGCGKTTLLNCIVGIKKLNNGQICVLGGKPGTPESGIPGFRVGYMPQDVALMGEFTIKDALYYFGRIYEMSDDKIEERFHTLTKLLQLTETNCYLKHCSGGQQRNVSFAVALIHEPELLILDEPTVGVDSILREKIWNYLIDITNNRRTTVIITTHYIEEARKANCIGLMRNGVLMVEESPNSLMELCGVKNLEEVFLILSTHQSDNDAKIKSHSNYKNRKDVDELLHRHQNNAIDNASGLEVKQQNSLNNNKLFSTETFKRRCRIFSSKRIKALLVKNIYQIIRNPMGIFLTFIFPILELCTFFYGLGSDPKGIRLAVVNNESTWMNCLNFLETNGSFSQYIPENDNCQLTLISCKFLNILNDSIAVKVFYDNIESARNSVIHGETTGVIYFSSNFTSATMARIENGRFTLESDLIMSEIKLWLDMSNINVGGILKRKLYGVYEQFMHSIMTDCQQLERSMDSLIRFETPVYGQFNDPYLVFLYPAFLVTLVFFMGISISSTLIIDDRLGGLWDRSLVAGVTYAEILLTHFIAQFLLIFIQIVEIFIIAMYVFEMKCHGNFTLLVTLLLLQGINGMLSGLLTSVVCSSQFLANFIVTGSFAIMIPICGLLWPLEGMPTILRWISLCLPFTMPIMSVRGVILKGLSLIDFEVFLGYFVSFVWIVIYLLLIFIALKKSK